MAGQLQLRRGTTIENDALVGAPGEVTVDTTLHQLRLHDGETQGGFVVGNGSGATLLDWKFADHQLSDISWLRADTFSWQSGSVYQLVYQHLSEDYTEVEEHSENETIAGITIEYYQAVDGHKIVLADQENNVESIYNATGVAWYYILDVEHQRFKLPRTKHNVVGLRDKIGGYVEAGLPDHYHNVRYRKNDNSGYHANGGVSPHIYTGSNLQGSYPSLNASQSNSIYGNSDTVQPPATQMYLYFFVGNFTQTAVENTAGLNAELFNRKVDTGHQVIAFQAPTAENNYTWYRKYADGWVEQGGAIVGLTDWANRTIDLPITMRDRGYSYVQSPIMNTSTGPGSWAIGVTLKTETQITSRFYANNGYLPTWEVKGMAAN